MNYQRGVSEFVLSYHAERVTRENQVEESEKYFGITKKGEKETRGKAIVLADKINHLPNGSVTILNGVSKAVRTRSTLEVYTDELQNIFRNRNDVIFFSKLDELKEIFVKIGEFRNDAKAIIGFPRQIKEFIGLPGQTAKEKALCLLWRINREEMFFRKFFPKNPLLFIGVGHSAELEALFSYIAKGGGKGKKFYFI